jgi:hypothetical protein
VFCQKDGIQPERSTHFSSHSVWLSSTDLFTPDIRGKKWYRVLFTPIIDTALVSAWPLYMDATLTTDALGPVCDTSESQTGHQKRAVGSTMVIVVCVQESDACR